MSATVSASASRVQKAWREALAVWDVATSLSPPEPFASGGKSHWKGNEPLAYIDLETRQVVVNHELLDRIGARDSLTAVLAHEVGHHVRFPHTLGLVAALTVLEKRLVPGLKQSLTNLFFDLLVNEHVGRTRADELIAVYRGFLAENPELAPVFAFYLAIYEELWQRPPGTLLPLDKAGELEKAYPGFRAEARVFVQTFYDLHDVHLQFVYFCCRFLRYIPDPSQLALVIPMGADVPAPDEDDFDAVLRGHGAAEADDALAEARERGWIEQSGVLDRKEEKDPLASIDRITSHLPGTAQAAFRQALVSKHYKRLVDQYILKLPAVTPPPEPLLPSVPEEWERGDSPKAIDWTATVLVQGALAGVKPLKRDLLPDEPAPLEQDLPAMEIYLDTSGSMPNPANALNAMTLAAQILSASTLRKRGLVRGIVYSSGPPLVSPWMYDEETARRFLLNYAGGGTDYPFGLLKNFAGERSDAIRVIISDSDFLCNVRGDGAMDQLAFGIEHSRLLVAFLALDEPQARAALEPVLRYPKFRLATVAGLDQFAKAAADLADALLGG